MRLNLAEAIRQIAKRSNISLSDLPEETGLSPEYLTDILDGKSIPNEFELIDIAKYLNIDLDILLGFAMYLGKDLVDLNECYFFSYYRGSRGIQNGYAYLPSNSKLPVAINLETRLPKGSKLITYKKISLEEYHKFERYVKILKDKTDQHSDPS